jgi:DNA excision repair protein ERCC-4
MDSVRYLQYLETLLSSYTPTLGALDRRERPAWLGTPAADTIFKTARNRVYRQKRVSIPDSKRREVSVDGEEIPDDLDNGDWTRASGPNKSREEEDDDDEEELLRLMEEQEREEENRRSGAEGTPKPPTETRARRWLPPGVELVLEEQPKWLLLSEVLEEIETQMHWAAVDPCKFPIRHCVAVLLVLDCVYISVNRRLLERYRLDHVQLVIRLLQPRQLSLSIGSLE